MAATGTWDRPCRACGRELPPQTGRGRLRLYCNASCRSAARRTRQADRASSENVKSSFTGSRCEGNWNKVWDTAPAVGLAARTRAINAAWEILYDVPHDTALAPLEAIMVIQSLKHVVDEGMVDAVRKARRAGHTWAEIGELLGTTRQAAFQRFGHSLVS